MFVSSPAPQCRQFGVAMILKYDALEGLFVGVGSCVDVLVRGQSVTEARDVVATLVRKVVNLARTSIHQVWALCPECMAAKQGSMQEWRLGVFPLLQKSGSSEAKTSEPAMWEKKRDGTLLPHLLKCIAPLTPSVKVRQGDKAVIERLSRVLLEDFAKYVKAHGYQRPLWMEAHNP